MSRRDRFHNAVVEGLKKNGWTITDDPLTLEFAGSLIGIDLGAEKLVAAEREGNRIAVEIKSFSGFSDVAEFEKALGQYLSYRYALRKADPDRKLFLAVPSQAWQTFFLTEDIQELVTEHALAVLVYLPDEEEVAEWIE